MAVIVESRQNATFKARFPTGLRGPQGLPGTSDDPRVTHGDSNFSILAGSRIVGLSTALTAPRVWTLPAANAVQNAGAVITVVDEVGGISSANTLTIQRSGSDTINGATSFVISTQYAAVSFRSNGATGWIVGPVLDGSVGTTAIPNDAITNAKLANVATATLKGRATAGTGDPEDLSASSARTVLGLGGAALLNVGTTTGTVAAGDDSRLSNTRTPTDGSVTTAKIGDGQVTNAKLADATLIALAGLATGADKLAYSTGTDTFAQTDFTTLARTLVGNTTIAAMATTLGFVTTTNAYGDCIALGGTGWKLQFGTNSIAVDTTINFPVAFTNVPKGVYTSVTQGGSTVLLACNADTYTTTTFDAHIRAASNGGTVGAPGGAVSIFWFAVGI